ncbi:hypothetical protein PS710_01140 [Pseudomonas fluorescens]|uniref:Uncharacterized protein n=1 Tax=Pseudomonas fluorescens TaxID=294 RepID=A0A5E7MJR2_PSEFL|nr:hypothetical protein PS710_01140 [Pseudomonas fluorescens]VVO92046.1 hypothetical protein PS850_02402 [Pseudomonas fluorescens]VVO96323.1 hypothetical protein PS903_02546 [Pseudomonas fluorescens]VVP25024.1 hypothetical protein PS838_04044 [Pseudomonas fluorescens]
MTGKTGCLINLLSLYDSSLTGGQVLTIGGNVYIPTCDLCLCHGMSQAMFLVSSRTGSDANT